MPNLVNVHSRFFPASMAELRPWLDAAWSVTSRDIFPRDVIPNWRKNPPGQDPQALLLGVTRIGHGPFTFRLVQWDGFHWRVEIETKGYVGWHGFEVREVSGGCELTHTLEAELEPISYFTWHALYARIHDWAVEAIFDRLEVALATGAVPEHTLRPMPVWIRAQLALLRVARGRRVRRIFRAVTA